jgi:hypothetical protein
MLFVRLLKHKNLLNNFKKNLYNKANTLNKNDFENEYINMYINQKQLKITNSTCCKYCKGTGWIIWKTNNNLHDFNKSLEPATTYSLCFKCNKF